MNSLNRLKLVSRRDVERRLYEIYWLLRRDYPEIIIEGEKIIDPFNLYTTQHYLESDKLGLVLRKTLLEGYSAPIIVIRGSGGRLYILDGHHRARIALWLRTLVKAYVLNSPRYKPKLESRNIVDIDFINPPHTVEDPIINVWRHIVNIIRFLEKKHCRIAYIYKDRIEVEELYTTQKKPLIRELPEKVLHEPILVYKYMDKYYIVDGHTRACLRIIEGSRSIDTVVFTLEKKIGLIDTAEILGMKKISSEWCLYR